MEITDRLSNYQEEQVKVILFFPDSVVDLRGKALCVRMGGEDSAVTYVADVRTEDLVANLVIGAVAAVLCAGGWTRAFASVLDNFEVLGWDSIGRELYVGIQESFEGFESLVAAARKEAVAS